MRPSYARAEGCKSCTETVQMVQHPTGDDSLLCVRDKEKIRNKNMTIYTKQTASKTTEIDLDTSTSSSPIRSHNCDKVVKIEEVGP